MFANVPRIITSWLPRRAPYELKSFFGDALRDRATCRPGLAAAMLPAGEMWSVVIESPNMPNARAPVIGRTPGGAIVMPSKYGGFFTYVDVVAPRVAIARRHLERAPLLVAVEHVRVLPLELLGLDRPHDLGVDFRRRSARCRAGTPDRPCRRLTARC